MIDFSFGVSDWADLGVSMSCIVGPCRPRLHSTSIGSRLTPSLESIMPIALITGGSEGLTLSTQRFGQILRVSLFSVCRVRRVLDAFHTLHRSNLPRITGIGLATAVKLASQGDHVAICGRTAEKLVQAAEVVKSKTGKQVLTIVADVRKKEDCERAVSETVAKFGGLDILVKWAAKGKGDRRTWLICSIAAMQGLLQQGRSRAYSTKIGGLFAMWKLDNRR